MLLLTPLLTSLLPAGQMGVRGLECPALKKARGQHDWHDPFDGDWAKLFPVLKTNL